MKSPISLIGGVAVALALALSSCATSGADSSGDGTFTYGVNTDPGTLNPLMSINAAARKVNNFAYDQLLYFDADGAAHGWLAEDWTETSTSVSFTLKPDITCADGSDFLASTAAANFTFLSDPANASPVLGVFIPPGLTATADDATRTVTLTAETPSSFLLFQAGTLQLACQSVIDDPSGYDAKTNGTGLYQLDSAIAGDRYVLSRRPDYAWSWDDTTADTDGLPASVTFRVVANASTMTNLLLSGELDAGQVTGDDVKRLAADDTFTAIGGHEPIGQLWFNQDPSRPTADQDVRRALVSALDLDEVRTLITAGTGVAETSLASYAGAACDYDSVSAHLPEHSTEDARSTLAGAGWTERAGGARAKDGQALKITLVYNNATPGQKAAAERIQQTWRDLGVETTLKGGDSNYVITNTLTEDRTSWDVSMLNVGAQIPSTVSPFLTGPAFPASNNFTGNEDPTYDDLVRKANQVAGSESCALWKAAEERVLSEVVVAPFAATAGDTFVSDTVTRTDADDWTIRGPAVRVGS